MTARTLVDAHVHLYRGFDLAAAFDAARRNFHLQTQTSSRTFANANANANANAGAAATDRSAPGVETAPSVDGCLCLAEDRDHDVFGELPAWKHPKWKVHGHPDEVSLELRWGGSADGDELRSTRSRLWIFSGRQIITAERLEVLALLTPRSALPSLPDGSSLAETVQAVRDCGAIPVLPWAVGKWMFSRGKIIAEFLQSTAEPVFLGDNGGRWDGLGGLTPARLSRMTGRPVLPGSDPLPLTGAEQHIGSYGFSLPSSIDPEKPSASFRSAVRSLAESPVVHGSTAGFARFVRDQARLRTKRLDTSARDSGIRRALQ